MDGKDIQHLDRISEIIKDVVGQDRDALVQFSGQGFHNVPFLPLAKDTSCSLPHEQENNIYTSKDINEKFRSMNVYKYDVLAKGIRHV